MSITLFPSKITVNSMGFALKELEAIAETGAGKPVSIMRVFGIVSDRKQGTSQFGVYTKFSGELAAVNLSTGEEARSQAMCLPSAAEGVVNSMFDKAAKEGGTAQIALEITVEYRKPKTENANFTKFAYGVKPLIEFKGDDALSAMAKLLPAPTMIKGLAIEAPKAEPAKASKK